MATSEIKEKILDDAVFVGLRAAIGVIFIFHGMLKFNPGVGGFLQSIGIPAELQIPIALAEIIPGILLIIGLLSRLSAALLSIIMIGAIFHVKQAQNWSGDNGIELDVLLIAGSLVIMIAGPGRISLVRFIKKLPRWIH